VRWPDASKGRENWEDDKVFWEVWKTMAFLCGEKICVCNSEKKQLDVAFCYPTVEMQIVIGPKKKFVFRMYSNDLFLWSAPKAVAVIKTSTL